MRSTGLDSTDDALRRGCMLRRLVGVYNLRLRAHAPPDWSATRRPTKLWIRTFFLVGYHNESQLTNVARFPDLQDGQDGQSYQQPSGLSTFLSPHPFAGCWRMEPAVMLISGQWTPSCPCPGGPLLEHGDHCPTCHGCHSGRLHFPNVYRQMPSLPQRSSLLCTDSWATSTGSSGGAGMVLIVAEDKNPTQLSIGKV